MRSNRKWLLILLSFTLALGATGAVIYYKRHQTARKKNRPKPVAEGEPRLVVQLGHSGSISSAVYSPDGRFIVSGGIDDQVAILWEVATGREIRRFVGHQAAINAVAFSPDSRFVLTGSGSDDTESETKDDTARLWDITSGAEVRKFEGHTDAVNAVAFSPDGKFILTGSSDKTARLWDANTGKEIRRLNQHETPVRAVAFSANGNFVLTGSGDGRGLSNVGCRDCIARLWETNTGQIKHTFDGPTQPIGSVAFSPDGRFILTAPVNPELELDLTDDKAAINQWEVSTGKSVRQYKGFGPVSFSPDSRLIITAGAGPKSAGAQVWDASTGAAVRYINGSQYDFKADGTEKEELGVVQVAAFAPNSSVVLVGFDTLRGGMLEFETGEKSLKTFEVKSGAELLSFKGAALAGSEEQSSWAGHLIQTGNYVWDTAAGIPLQLKRESKPSDDSDVALHVLSKDGKFVAIDNRQEIDIWEVATGALISSCQTTQYEMWFTPGNKYLFVKGINELGLYEVKTGRVKWKYPLEMSPRMVVSYREHRNNYSVLSPNGRFVVALTTEEPPVEATDEETGEVGSQSQNVLLVIDTETGQVTQRFQIAEENTDPSIAISPDNRFVAVGNDDRTITIFDLNAGEVLRRIEKNGFDLWGGVFSPDSKFFATQSTKEDFSGAVQVWELATGKLLYQFPHGGPLGEVIFSPGGDYLLTSTGMPAVGTPPRKGYNIAYLWNLTSGKVAQQFENYDRVTSSAFSPDGHIVLTESADGTSRLWATETGKELCRLVSLQNGDWIVTTPDGRFDTNNLDDIKGMHWILSSEPLRPLPLEIFMRQYYEPKLLARVLAGEKLKPLPSLAELNRTQPDVKITEIKPDGAETVQVTLEVANARSAGQKDAAGNAIESGVYDVRLFRDGQLVGYAPKDQGAVKDDSWWSWLFGAPATDDEGAVELDKEGKATLKFSNIKFPRTGVEQVEFSAYAFNADRIKSATDRRPFKLATKPAPAKGRAYVISLGVNASERDALSLRYAANDARQMQTNVVRRLAAQGAYEEVVGVQLVSDFTVTLADGRTVAAQEATVQDVRSGRLSVTENHATKAHLQAVLDVLAGRPADAALLKALAGADKLRAARPEDLVIISASSHGYTDSDGIFYLVPSDTGTAAVSSPEFRQHCISSDELSRWLRDVDAGELVLIVDACHSSAAVEGTDFKPGPMGSRGLGQLSYDKGMKILTATQSDSVAYETDKVRQGLLMYALLQDGLGQRNLADYKPRDQKIMLTEWLGYGVERVPRLYEEVKAGQSSNKDARIVRETVDLREADESKTQVPSLFNFARRQREVVLARPS